MDTLDLLTAHGSCRGLPNAFFFPTTEIGIARAKEVCEGCPVRQVCLEYGIEHEQDGIWGGLSEEERRLIRRARRGGVAA